MSADNLTKCPRCGETFREYCDMGIDLESQTFYVSYHGTCRDCEYDFVYKYECPLPKDGTK